MFPLQRGDDFVPLQIPSSSLPTQQDQIPQDLVGGSHVSLDTTNNVVSVNSATQRRQRRLGGAEDNNVETTTKMDGKLKRIIHRDIERQRRQEMANLYASLRSLLPLEYIKGKRSISDHMHEAVKYIKHLEKNIKELHMRRDKLKLYHDSGGGNTSFNRVASSPAHCVSVSLCQVGVEILVSSTNVKEGSNFPLSKVMQALLNQGLHLVSCMSTTGKERSLHKIHSEAGETTCIDVVALQQKICDAINHELNFDQ